MHSIIFDMDNVVVLSERLHLKTLDAIFKPFGIRYSRKMHSDRLAGTGAENIIRTVLSEHGISANVKALVEKRTKLYEELIRKNPRALKITPGFSKFLKALRSSHFSIALASGGYKKNVTDSLKLAGLDAKMFKAIITIEKAHQRKPHPRIFLAAARALRARANECIVFEDSIAGVQAAKRAHMRCVALLTTTTRHALKRAGANLIVKDFRDPRLWRWLELTKKRMK